MQVIRYVLQDPGARLSWLNDWTDFLGENETITGRQWRVEPMNPGSPQTPVLTNDTTGTVILEGLLLGNVYHLTERVTMLSGMIEEQTIVVRCEQT